ncbi:MAG: hypothetical protein C5B56_05370, partial [Proteobacteria bacterium]
MASQLTWTGATSNDWLTATNWLPNEVPAAGDTLTVASGTPAVTGSVENETIILGGAGATSAVTLTASNATFTEDNDLLTTITVFSNSTLV